MKYGLGLYSLIFFSSSSAFVQTIANFFCAMMPSTICGRSLCSSGSPPAITTTGAPHSRTDSSASATGRRLFRISSG